MFRAWLTAARRVLDLAHFINPVLQKLSSTQTPLMGGDGPDIANSDFGGITPRNVVPSTPHALSGAAARQMLLTLSNRRCNCREHGTCFACAPNGALINAMNVTVFPINSDANLMQVLHRVLVRRQLQDEQWQASQQHRGVPLLERRCALPVSLWHMVRHGPCGHGVVKHKQHSLLVCKASREAPACLQVVAAWA